jgi:ornithine cyclodeaminase
MRLTLLSEAEIRDLVEPADAIGAVRAAFVSLAEGRVTMPTPSEMYFEEARGDIHVKGAFLHGAPYFSYKAASGFYDNPQLGLPTNAGLVLVFDARTGFPAAVLLDNGYLTDLRTGAAGAVAADLLARHDVDKVAVLGAGVQARRQLELLTAVRTPAVVEVWARRPEQAEEYAAEMAGRLGLDVRVAPGARAAVEGAAVVVTTTPAREPLVEAAWLEPGQHLTAVGADVPEKQELAPDVFGRLDKIVVDSRAQALRSGDTQGAVAAGVITADDIHAELGEIAAGARPGRESDAEITLADLTGLGAQDAAMANLVTERAVAAGLGRTIEI